MTVEQSNSDIAIVGMSATFAGASDLAQYWQNIVDKVDAVSIAPDSWARPYFDPDAKRNDRIYTRKGGFLGELAEFNPIEFGIMPNAVDGGEPDQYLALKLANAALKDAGYDKRSFNHATTGVILGRGTYINRGYTTLMQHGMMVDQTLELLRVLHPGLDNETTELLRTGLKEGLPPFTPEMCPGLVPNIVSGLIANRLDLMGPNFIVDAACASSLVAIDLAIKELLSGRCDMVLTGGVHACTPPQIYMIFCQLQALSRNNIRPFDQQADGVLLGEGCGILILKRLKDAERDGDQIYAVIKGVGIASDGKALGLFAPRLEGQILALQRAYERAGADPSTVGLIEAHGTGIVIGDQTEIKALCSVFGQRGQALPRIAVGSVKSMIGHCIPAAGAAGIIKAVLALHHKILPPTLCGEVNANLGIEGSGLYINTKSRPWIHDASTPRLAGVNAFGFGGINAHVVLEEYRGPKKEPEHLLHSLWPTELFIFSGDTCNDMLGLVDRVLAFLDFNPQTSLASLASKLAQTPGGSKHRLAVIATGHKDFKEKLGRIKARIAQSCVNSLQQASNGIYYAHSPMPGKVAFLFPGEGSQYPNMLGDLCMHFPQIRHWFDFLDDTFRDTRELLPSTLIFPPPNNLTKSERLLLESDLFDMDLGSEAVFTASMALYELLRDLGVKCDTMVGHSTGENTALVASGILGNSNILADKMRQLNHIYRELRENSRIPKGGLLAVGAITREALNATLAKFEGRLYLAMDNCPNQVVLFGSEVELASLSESLKTQGAIFKRLPFDRAYHTPLFEDVTKAFSAFYQSLLISGAHTQVFSCTELEFFPDDPQKIRTMAARQWARQVRFHEAIEHLYAQGFRIFIEVGPSGNLTSFVKDILGGREYLALSSNSPRHPDLTQLHHLLGRLFANGFDVNLQPLFRGRKLATCELGLDLTEPCSATGIALEHNRLELAIPALCLSPDYVAKFQARGFAHSMPSDKVTQAHTVSSVGAGASVASEPNIPSVSVQFSLDPRVKVAALKDHFELMQRFLSNQAQVMARFGPIDGTVPLNTVLSDPSKDKTIAVNVGQWPLIGEVLENTTTQLVFKRRFDIDQDIFLRHHTLGGAPSRLDQGLLALAVIPFTFSMELMAEAADFMVPTGYKVVGMRNVRGYRWLTLDDGFIDLHVHAQLIDIPNNTGDRQFRIRVYKPNIGGPELEGVLVLEGNVVMASKYGDLPQPLKLTSLALRPSALKSSELYNTGMFHGPLLQGVKHIHHWSPEGIEAELEALPVNEFFAFTPIPNFAINPGLLDATGQLVGYWLSEQIGSDFNCFPFKIMAFDQYTPWPSPGNRVSCRGNIRFTADQRLESTFDLLGADGRLIARLEGREDRYFSVPHKFYRYRLDPQHAYLSEPLELEDDRLICRRIEPFTEYFLEDGWGIWKRVLAHLVLNRQERRVWYAMECSEPRRIEWLLGRIVAKDAVRMWAMTHLELSLAPADVEVKTNAMGKPFILCQVLGANTPDVSITHTQGHAMAVAAIRVKVGIDLIRLEHVTAYEDLLAGCTEEERTLLNNFAHKDVQVIDFWCAKEAASKALGTGLLGNTSKYRVTDFDPETGECLVMHLERILTVRVIKRQQEIIAVCVDPDQAHL